MSAECGLCCALNGACHRFPSSASTGSSRRPDLPLALARCDEGDFPRHAKCPLSENKTENHAEASVRESYHPVS